MPSSALFPGVIFGAHVGLQHTTPDELQQAWHLVEALGFDWISVFDHLYAANGTTDTHCLEAVAIHSLLAASTSHVRCGCLVYVPSYRHPAILAKASATLDIISGGRVTVGLGAGWHRYEYEAFGLPYLHRRDRIEQMSEAFDCLDALLNGGGPATYEGKFFSLSGGQCNPPPVQRRLPLWIGGGGEKLTLAVAARADGWNVALVSPEVFAHKRGVLAQHCERIGRRIGDVTCSVNIGVAWDEEQLLEQFGRNAAKVSDAVLTGSPERMREQVAAYVAAGAQQINIAVRARPGKGHQLDEFRRLADLLQLTPRQAGEVQR